MNKNDLKKYYETIARNGNMAVPVPKKTRQEVIAKVLSEVRSREAAFAGRFWRPTPILLYVTSPL